MKLNNKILGKGDPLIIAHGLFGMLDNMQATARLLENDFSVIIVDMRNHGHSPHSQEMNYDVMAADLSELMDELGLVKSYFLGHSMGGKAVMKLAQQQPEAVSKLIVSDIGPKYYPAHHQRIIAALRAIPLDKIEKRSDAEVYMLPFIAEASVRQFLMKNLYHPDRGSFAWRFNLDAIEQNIKEVGKALEDKIYHGETLFVRGSQSGYISNADWPEIQKLFPSSQLETIIDVGHWIHAEKPQEFCELVKDFLLS